MRKKSSTGADIAGRLKARRQSLGISSRKCAGLLDINPATLAAIEDGRTTSPSIDHLTKIASFLNLSLDELLNVADWVCAPRDLHETAIELGLAYKDVSSLNSPALREAARSKAQWRLLARMARERPELLMIVKEHPKTLDTIARETLQTTNR